jgi:membrane protease YdiL (CAAX protease family)
VAGANRDDRSEAVAAFRDVLAALDRKPPIPAPANARGALLARLAVTLLESGRAAEAQDALARLDGEGDEGRGCAALIRLAYGLGPTAPTAAGQTDDAALDGARSLMALPGAPVPGWTTTRLEQRVRERRGDTERAAKAADILRTASARYGGRANVMAMLFYGLLGLGLLTLAVMALRRRWFAPVSTGLPYPPWTMEAGWTVTVRGGAAALLAFVGLEILKSAVGLKTLPLATFLCALPLLFLLDRSLLAPAGLELPAVFGLRPSVPLRQVAAAALGLIALEQGVALVVGFSARALGHGLSWSESLDEDLIFGGLPVVVARLLDGIVVAPVIEEIACRGLVYGSLRARFGPLPAALISAGLFAALHVYEPVGFAIIFVAAVISALVYERTRSLLPSMTAHVANNAFALLIEPLLYR